MTLQLETGIPLHQVAKKYGVPPEALTRLARDGIIRLSRTQKGDSVIAVSTSTVAAAANMILDEINPEQYEHLRGNRIRLTDAAEKYQIAKQNLARWTEYGYLRVIERGFQYLELDEADVSFAVNVYNRACVLTDSPIKGGWVLKQVFTKIRLTLRYV